MRVIVTSAPASEPVTTAEAKKQANIPHTDDDAYLDTLVTAARRLLERQTGLAFITQTLEVAFDRFPSHCFEIPRPPLQSVTSVTYIDVNGVEQTLSSSLYQVDKDTDPGSTVAERPARIQPVHGEVWPDTREQRLNGVRIRYDAGFGAASAVPGELVLAVKMLVAYWYENRETVTTFSLAEIPLGIRALFEPYRVHGFGG